MSAFTFTVSPLIGLVRGLGKALMGINPNAQFTLPGPKLSLGSIASSSPAMNNQIASAQMQQAAPPSKAFDGQKGHR